MCYPILSCSEWMPEYHLQTFWMGRAESSTQRYTIVKLQQTHIVPEQFPWSLVATVLSAGMQDKQNLAMARKKCTKIRDCQFVGFPKFSYQSKRKQKRTSFFSFPAISNSSRQVHEFTQTKKRSKSWKLDSRKNKTGNVKSAGETVESRQSVNQPYL